MTITGQHRLGYSAHLAVLITTVIGTNIGYTALLPYLPRLSENLGLSSAGLAVFLTGFAVTKILGQPLGGYLADAWGLRITAAAALTTAAAGMVLVIAADTASPAIWGRLIWGAGDGILTPVLYRALTMAALTHRRDPAGGYAKLGSAAVLSFAAGPFVVGLAHPFAGYQAVLAATAGLTLLNGAVAWRVLPGRAQSAPADDTPATGPHRWRPLLRAVALFGVIDLFANLLWAAMEPLVPLYLDRAYQDPTYQDPTGRAAWALGIGMTAFAAANPLLARLPHRWRQPHLAGPALAALGLSCIALSGVTVPTIGLPAIVIFMIGQSYIYLIARNGIQHHGGGTGRAWGIFGMFSDAGLIAGPLAALLLFETFGAAAFPILGLISIAAAATLTTTIKTRRPPLRPQQRETNNAQPLQ